MSSTDKLERMEELNMLRGLAWEKLDKWVKNNRKLNEDDLLSIMDSFAIRVSKEKLVYWASRKISVLTL